MKFATAVAAAALCAATLTLGTTSASAAVACNREGECWHVKNAYNYHPEFGVTVHTGPWRWGPHEHFRWREHRGRGYWKNGLWVTF